MKLDMKILGIGFIAVIVLSLSIEHCFSIFFNPNALLVSTDSYEHLLMGRLQLTLIISPVLVLILPCSRQHILTNGLLLMSFSFVSFLIVFNNGLGEEDLIDPVFLSDVSFDEKKEHYISNIEMIKKNNLILDENFKMERLIEKEEDLRKRVGKSIHELNLVIENLNTIIIEKEQLKDKHSETTKSL